MWESLYNSAWHQPISFWFLQALFVALVLWRPLADRRQTAFVLLGVVVAALDAWATQARSPLPAAWQTGVGITFVILGDWRYWVVLLRLRRPDMPWWRSLSTGGVLAFVVPVLVLLPQRLGWLPGGRPLFLTYELGALALALGMAWRWRLRHPLVGFWLVMYGGWALADVVILWRGDLGFLLRLVPNTLYYAVFWPVVYAAWWNAAWLKKESR